MPGGQLMTTEKASKIMYYVESLEYLITFDLLSIYRSLGTLTYIPKVGHRDDLAQVRVKAWNK